MLQKDIKKVLVTGSSSGLGLAIAREFAKNYHVIAHSRNSPLSGQFEHYRADLSIPITLPPAEVVVCAAGEHIKHKCCCDIDQKTIDRIIGSNLLSVIHTCTAAIPYMRKIGGGALVLIGSLKSKISDKSPIYALSKDWVAEYARRLERDLRQHSIAVHCFILGNVVSVDESIYPKGTWNNRHQTKVEACHNVGTYLRAEDVAIMIRKMVECSHVGGIYSLEDNETASQMIQICDSL
jgi:short-subunit dehydrogenase